MKPLVIFYLLVTYILFQFGWWAYLLIDLNKVVYQQKIELLKNDPQQVKGEEPEEHILIKKMHERWLMVAGEGAVFLGLLLTGIFITRKAFSKEEMLSRQQKNFILSITHEFKSPLAAIKLNLQTLQKHQLEKEKQQIILNQSVHEADRIDALVENALLVARIDGHSYTLTHEQLSLGDLVKHALRNRYPGFASTKIEQDLEDGVHIYGDAFALTSLLLNLTENAEKYSGNEKVIKVMVRKHGEHALLVVSDQGIGIPDEEKSKIFDKFYRIGNEDTRKSKGTGLGLFIVKHLVSMHKGTILVKNNIPKGTVFEISFPLIKE